MLNYMAAAYMVKKWYTREILDKLINNLDNVLLLVKGLDSVSCPIAFVISLYFVLRFMERRYKK